MGACMSIDEDTMQIVCGPAKPTLRARRRMLTQMLDAESKVADILSKMPGRICGNGSTLSSCAFSKQGRKGVNQDCMLIWEEYAAQSDTVFCGIFDGHGRNGHVVAKKVRDSLPVLLALPLKLLAEEYNKIDKEDATTDEYKLEDDNDEDFGSLAHEKTDKDTLCTLCNFYPADDMAPMSKLSSEQWRVKLVGACRLMDRTLNVHPKIHCFESGTTALTMVVQGETIVIGNVGDSRAVLGKRLSDGSVVAEQLTTDLKPNLPRELERIKRHKGRVFALYDEPGVARIWLPDSDMPGLAMARALGDFCLKDYGLSSVPQVCVRRLAVEDQFIVLATDGIWDVLSNDQVVAIVSSTSPKEKAAKALVDAAVRAWKVRYGSWRTDDCSAVCYFIKNTLTPTTATTKQEHGLLQIEALGESSLQAISVDVHTR